MAIIIPSKHIYGDRQNAKVRDNVIERIEVKAKEVVPDNDYETPVYNKNILLITDNYITESNTDKEKLEYSIENDPIVPSELYYYRAYAYIDSTAEYAIGTIEIPRLNNNKFVATINYGTDKQKIESSLFISKKVAPITGTLFITGYNTISDKTINIGSATVSQVTSFPDMPTSITKTQSNAEVTLYGVNNTTNLTVSYIETENNYKIEYRVLKKLTEIKYSGAGTINSSSNSTAKLEGEKVEYNADKIEITVYGNTIGIDFTDKTVYINGELQKKVHSIDGNELMQTSNYYNVPVKLVEGQDYKVTYYDDLEGQYPSAEGDYGVTANIQILNNKLFGSDFTVRLYNGQDDTKYYDTEFKNHQSAGMWVDDGGYYIGKAELFLSNQNAINKMFSDTQAQYARGKETATIRCSISDYYDSDNGFLKVSTKGRQNLVQFPYVKRNATAGGVTFTLQEDGGIHLQGTPTANEYITFSPNIDLEEGQTYTFSLYGTKNENIHFETILSDKGSDTNKEWVIATGDKTITKTIPNGKGVSYWALSLATPLIGVYLDEVVYPMVNKGTTASPYQPYNINMSFQEGDIVIPMVYGVNGQDRPMSTYQDGTAKQFMVLGAKKFFDGAVWQELYLQEIAQPIDN